MTAKEIAEAWKDTGTWIPAETVKQLCRAYLAQEKVVEAARHEYIQPREIVCGEERAAWDRLDAALADLDDLE